jgi:hypothetical protein
MKQLQLHEKQSVKHLLLVFSHKLLCDCKTNEEAQAWTKKS